MQRNKIWYCAILVFLLYSSYFCSTYLLIAMTFERFYSIIKPHKAASFNTVKKAKIIIVCIYAFGFSYSIPFWFTSDNSKRSCISNKYASDNVLGELYYWLTEIITFVFPFVSLLTMNSIIIHTLRKRSKLNLLEPTGEADIEDRKLKSKQPEKQIFTMLLLVTFVFLILNVPTRTMVFYLNFYTRNTPHHYASFHLIYQVGEKTYFTNHGINFFLYVMSGQKFRTDLRKLFLSNNFQKNHNDHRIPTASTICSNS